CLAVRPIISGNRKSHGTHTAFQLEQASHNPLAEGSLADHHSSLMILQTSSNDFSGRSGPSVYEQRHRKSSERAFRPCVIHRFFLAALNGDNPSVFDEQIRNRNRTIEQTARAI